MSELQQFAGTEWVGLYPDELNSGTLQQHLDAAIGGAVMRGRCRALQSGWAGLDWKGLAQLTMDVYYSLIGPAPKYRANVRTSGTFAK
jgi:hypothetical protein